MDAQQHRTWQACPLLPILQRHPEVIEEVAPLLSECRPCESHMDAYIREIVEKLKERDMLGELVSAAQAVAASQQPKGE